MKNKSIPHLSLLIKIRSIIFWVLFSTAVLIYCFFGYCLYPLNDKLRHGIIAKSWAWIINKLFIIICGLKYNVVGSEHIKSVDGAAIIASNHQSLYETLIFNLVFPQHVWVLKKELLKIPFFGWTLATVSPIAIDRSRGEESIKQISQQGRVRVNSGFWIMFFPEGTRMKPKAVKPFKAGASGLAISLNLPILPTCHNAGYAIPKNSFWIYPGMVDIVIGKPISSNNKTTEQLTVEVESWVRENLAKIDG